MKPELQPRIDDLAGNGAGLSIHTARQKANRFVAIMVCVGLLGSVGLLITGSAVQINADASKMAVAHGMIEWIGALLGLVAGLALIMHFAALGNRLYLFIGLAFFVNGAEDLVHGLFCLAAEYNWLRVEQTQLAQYIRATYVTGMMLFGILLILAPFAPRLLGASRSPKREMVWVSSIVLLGTVVATAVAFMLPLPRSIYPESVISRPVDFVSAAILVAAFVVFAQHYRRHGEVICWWVLLSISVNIIGQLMMSTSESLFDVPFNIALVYKLLGYVVPLLGFCICQLAIIAAYRRTEKQLREHQDHLEELVETRTVELNQTNIQLQEENVIRQRAEEAARKSEEHLRITLASIGDGVIATDTQRRVTRLNKVAEELTGWTARDASGKALEEVFHIINEQTRAPAKDPVARALAFGRIEGLANHTVLVARDGTERAIADSAAPIRGANGQIVGVVLVFRDITEDRQHQKEKEQLLHVLRERIKELNCLYDLSRIVERTGITVDEILQEGVRLLPPAWQYPKIACGRIRYQQHVFETDNYSDSPWCQSADILVHARKTGSVQVCYREASPEADEGPFLKDERCLIASIAERLGRIIERKEAEDELEQFNRLAVGREERMIELKREVNEMARKAGAAPPYDLAFAEPGKGGTDDEG